MPDLSKPKQYRWFIYGKIGTCILFLKGMGYVLQYTKNKPYSNNLQYALNDAIIAVERLRIALSIHIQEYNRSVKVQHEQ